MDLQPVQRTQGPKRVKVAWQRLKECEFVKECDVATM